MPKTICNTSPLQYLHQLEQLHLLPALAGSVIVPTAVVAELVVGLTFGVNLPHVETLDWVVIRTPTSKALLPRIDDLGPGEAEVLTLALEVSDAVVILDDRLAREVAQALGIRITGTLGVLLEAKKAGLIPAVGPLLDRLQALGFRLAPTTRAAVLRLSGEAA